MTPHEFAEKLLELLGVPTETCRKAIVRMEPDQPITIEAEYWAEPVTIDDMAELQTYTKRFELIDRVEIDSGGE